MPFQIGVTFVMCLRVVPLLATLDGTGPPFFVLPFTFHSLVIAPVALHCTWDLPVPLTGGKEAALQPYPPPGVGIDIHPNVPRHDQPGQPTPLGLMQ